MRCSFMFQYCSPDMNIQTLTFDSVPLSQPNTLVRMYREPLFRTMFQYCSPGRYMQILLTTDTVPVLQPKTLIRVRIRTFFKIVFQYCSPNDQLYHQHKGFRPCQQYIQLLSVLRSSIAASRSSIAALCSSVAALRSSIEIMRSSIAARKDLRSSIAALRSGIATPTRRIPVLQLGIYPEYSFLGTCVPVLQPISIVL